MILSDQPLPKNGKPILQTEKLVKIYGGRAVVNGVDINCRRGEIVGLLGPNGAGKTTSFYMIVGLVQPNSGRVTFEDQDVTHAPMFRRARMGMGYLPQEESIFRKLTVEENLMAILETTNLNRKEVSVPRSDGGLGRQCFARVPGRQGGPEVRPFRINEAKVVIDVIRDRRDKLREG